MKWIVVILLFGVVSCRPVIDVSNEELTARIEFEVNHVFYLEASKEQLEFSHLEFSKELVCLEGLEFDCPSGPVISPLPVTYKDYDVFVGSNIVDKQISQNPINVLPEIMVKIKRNGDFPITTSYHPETVLPSTKWELNSIDNDTGVIYLDTFSEDYEFIGISDDLPQACSPNDYQFKFDSETNIIELDTNMFYANFLNSEESVCKGSLNFIWSSKVGIVSSEYKSGEFALLYKLTIQVDNSN